MLTVAYVGAAPQTPPPSDGASDYVKLSSVGVYSAHGLTEGHYAPMAMK